MTGNCMQMVKQECIESDIEIISNDELGTLMDLDIKKLIAEVEKRPAIYDISRIEYADRSSRKKAWREICQILVPKWRSLSNEEKNIEEKSLRGKWRNMRDYFMKEYRYETLRKECKDKIRPKRKRCVYYNQLLFLTTSKTIRKDDQMHQCDNPSIAHDTDEEYIGNSNAVNAFEFLNTPDYHNSMCETPITSSVHDDTNPLKNSHDQKSQDEEDYDRMFLLSLLPIMRKIPEDQKLDVRIQMQQAIASALNKERTEK